MDSSTRFEDLPDILNVDEVAEYLRLSRTAVYEAIRARLIPAVRIGRRTLVSRRALLAFVEETTPQERGDEGIY